MSNSTIVGDGGPDLNLSPIRGHFTTFGNKVVVNWAGTALEAGD